VTCNIPTNLITAGITSDEAKLKWDVVDGAMAYTIGYKIAGTSEWIMIKTMHNHKGLGGLVPGTEYFWKWKSICSQEPFVSSEWSEKQSFATDPLRIDAVHETTFEVYPNPVSQSAIISFSLNEGSPVVMQIIDVNGRSIRVIADENFSDGGHDVTFDRESLAAGIYFLQVKTDQGVTTKKMVLE
jgi:hypothetical protein